MIKQVAKVGVCVSDQQRAVDFFTQVLGFELIEDQPMGKDRWIEVVPPGSSTALALWTPPGMEDRIGSFTGVVLQADDVNATYKELSDKGVKFTQVPKEQPGGVMGVFQDPDGNSFVLRN